MTDEIKADVIEEAAPAAAEEAPSQEKDPVAAELERVNAKPKRTRLEQLEYTRRRVDEQLAEERKKAGLDDLDDDNRPLTVREFRDLQAQTAQETALSLVDSTIEDEKERELTKYHLENTIKPSGDPQTDLRNARALVNAVKNSQVAEDALRAKGTRAHGSSASAPPKEKGKEIELSREEALFAKGTGLTPEEVAAALK